MNKIIVLGFISMALMGCNALKAIDSVNATPGKMDDMNNQMKEMVAAVHLQKLSIAVDSMSKPENEELLFPVPTALMPAGQAFAEAATRKELMETTELWLNQIEEVSPLKDLDANGDEVPYTLDKKNQIRRHKLATLYALITIAGFTPDAMITDIINNDIRGESHFHTTGLQFLMMRTMFIRDVMLQSRLLAKPMDTSGTMNEALLYLNKLETILRLPFVQHIGLKINDKELQLVTVDESLANPDTFKSAANMWQVAYDRAQDGAQELKDNDWMGDAAENQKYYNAELARQTDAMQTMKAHADAWKSVTAPTP